MKFAQQGFAHIIILLLLLVGLAATIYLVGQKTNLFSRASTSPIVFKNSAGEILPVKNGIPQSTSATVKIEFTSTLTLQITPSPTIKPTTTYTFCDANKDGKEDLTDGKLVQGCWDKSAPLGACGVVDLDKNGRVDIVDIQKFSYQCPHIFSAPTITPTVTSKKIIQPPSVQNPTKTPSSFGMVKGASTNTGISYRFAENPVDLDKTSFSPYISTPTIIDYTFKDPKPGIKFIWVEFKDNSGRTDRRSGQIEIISAPPSDPIFLSGFKNALFFDSNRQSPSLVVTGSNKIGSFNGLTMEAWIKLKENPQVSEGYPIIYKNFTGGASGDTFAYLLSITKDKKLKFTYSVLYQGRWAPTEITSNSTISPDAWTHVAVLYYTGEQKCITGQCKSDDMLNKIGLYINGQQVAVQQQTGTIGGGNERGSVMVGSDGYDYFSGVLDDIRISNGIQYLGPSFSVPQVPSGLNPPPLGGISSAAGVLLLCHFDENGGNPTCNNSDGTTFQTVTTNLSFVTHCTSVGCEIILATPTPSPSPTPSKRVNSSIITSNKSWPTSTYGNYRNGDLRVEYSANQYFNIRYWLEFSNCPVAGVSPGYYTYTGATTSFAQNFSVNLSNTSSAKDCTFKLKGTDALGAYVPDASVTVTINPTTSPTPTAATTPTPSPTAASTPTPTPSSSKRIFITSTSYTGDLGGLSGADTKCQARADVASLRGTWKAWLSDSVTSATSRLTHNTGTYKLVNGVKVANNWDDLVDGSLLNTISINEKGASNTYLGAWTNTSTDGNRFSTDSGKSCSNWTAGYWGPSAEQGAASYTNSNWTSMWDPVTCQNTAALYCFEQ